jgi:hypothetical protein
LLQRTVISNLLLRTVTLPGVFTSPPIGNPGRSSTQIASGGLLLMVMSCDVPSKTLTQPLNWYFAPRRKAEGAALAALREVGDRRKPEA